MGKLRKNICRVSFFKDFRLSKNFSKRIIIENENEINLIKEEAKPVIFISGHFNNFELMAMYIEKSGIDLAAIYRPLNNKFLNPIMENIRKNYICKKQIKKGIAGTKDLLKYFKNGHSVALMIDQRVSEGIHSEFFNQKALTTTIPAQFVKKFNAKIVPVYIERIGESRFKIKFYKSIKFSSNDTLESITLSLNILLEEMIKKILNNGSGLITDGNKLLFIFLLLQPQNMNNMVLEDPHSNKLKILMQFFYLI